ncbi:uncharacterized protein LOC122653806 [Telopea speciosissima]|uniref:uncharacterized protein LOC122653806 n=1 Tax=Telopea speciosissima TaxID=54955 RepID=UPI001CC7BB01|nr:uncharacterized protein LOC122653806 [Telopea speciosissima]
MAVQSSNGGFSFILSSPKKRNNKPATGYSAATFSPFRLRSMATQKPILSATRAVSSKKGSMVFSAAGEAVPRSSNGNSSSPVKLLTRVEQLRLLTKAEKAGLLSAAENFGLSLSIIEKLGVLSKAEEFGVLSAATDPGTPGALLSVSLGLLVLGPLCVYIVPEEYPWEVVLQVLVALICVIGGSAALAASNLVSNLQKSS